MTTDTVAKVAAATVGGGPARVVGHRQGRRDDRARHGDDDRRPAHRRRRRRRPSSTTVFRRVVERHVQLRQHRHRHVDQRHRGRPRQRRRRPGRRPTTSRPRCGDGRRLADPADRPRRRGRRDADRGRTSTAARDRAQAKRVAKAIVNSPLVKTAVHGADPNWGRVAMAIGKCADDTDIDQERVVIRFGDAGGLPDPGRRRRARRAVGLPARRRGAHPRLARRRRRRLHRVGLRPHRRLRPHQRRLHDLTTPIGAYRATWCGPDPHAVLADGAHFGGMRMPPSTRMVSAFM